LASGLGTAASVFDCEFTIKLRRKEGEAVNPPESPPVDESVEDFFGFS
jgi:hypothetical protein